MKIYLGTKGSESLITNVNRAYGDEEQEACDDVITNDETTFRYTEDKTKKIFNFYYSRITATDLATIKTEYEKRTELNLKIETTTSGVYDEYTVLFDGPIKKDLFKDLKANRYYNGYTFRLKEV